MLKLCLLSPATMEVMLNCYPVVPDYEDWLHKVPDDLLEVFPLHFLCFAIGFLIWSEYEFPSYPQEHKCFFDSVRRSSAKPRTLQHLCRCSLRLSMGARCHSAIDKLNIPCALKKYLLLQSIGEILWYYMDKKTDKNMPSHELGSVKAVHYPHLIRVSGKRP